jgi:hypothetical protein
LGVFVNVLLVKLEERNQLIKIRWQCILAKQILKSLVIFPLLPIARLSNGFKTFRLIFFVKILVFFKQIHQIQYKSMFEATKSPFGFEPGH